MTAGTMSSDRPSVFGTLLLVTLLLLGAWTGVPFPRSGGGATSGELLSGADPTRPVVDPSPLTEGEGPASPTFLVQFKIVPASCGPVQVAGRSQANNSSVMLASGESTFSFPACPGMGPLPGFSAQGEVYLPLPYNELLVSGNGTLVVTYYDRLSTRLTGPSTGTVGTVLAFRVLISGGNLAYTELWSFGDSTRKVNTTGSPTSTHSYSAAGTYEVQVWVNDTEPELTLATLNVTITGGGTSGSAGISVQDVALVGGVVLIGALAALAIVSKRRSRPQASGGTSESTSSAAGGGPTPSQEDERMASAAGRDR